MNKQSVLIAITITVLLGIVAASCQHDPLTPLSEAPIISFKDQVQPVIISNCTQSGCHGSNGGEFHLITHEDIAGRINAGDPHGSKLYKTITANAIGQMPPPPNPHLSDTDIKTIYLWIAQGANNN